MHSQLQPPRCRRRGQPGPRHRHARTRDVDASRARARNGVDTATLFATLDAVKQASEAARFQFRARNEWLSGTHNCSTIADYFGAW